MDKESVVKKMRVVRSETEQTFVSGEITQKNKDSTNR